MHAGTVLLGTTQPLLPGACAFSASDHARTVYQVCCRHGASAQAVASSATRHQRILLLVFNAGLAVLCSLVG